MGTGAVVVVNAEQMGRGDDGLGAKLLANFLRWIRLKAPDSRLQRFPTGSSSTPEAWSLESGAS